MRLGSTNWTNVPSFTFLLVVFVFPFAYMIWLSFTDLSFSIPENTGHFVGVQNYVFALWYDELFWKSMRNSLFYTCLTVVPELVAALWLAEVLWKSPKWRGLLSFLFILPVLVPSVVVGMYWRVMLQGEFGVLSYALAAVGFEGAKRLLSNPETVMLTLATVDFWHWTPFMALVLYAGRSSLPNEPLEAAYIDGASGSRAYLDVTLRALVPIILFVAILRGIDSFKEFDKVYVMTGGGPGTSSELISLYIWRTAFKSWKFGYAAALSMITYVLIFMSSTLSLRMLVARVFR